MARSPSPNSLESALLSGQVHHEDREEHNPHPSDEGQFLRPRASQARPVDHLDDDRGGPDQFAKLFRIRIFRRQGGKTVIIPFDYDDVIAGKNLESNILRRRGDVVVVP